MKLNKHKFCAWLLLTIIVANLSFQVVSGTTKKIRVNARSAIAMDSDSKIVLFEQNSKELIPMASTTKIMTTLVALNYGDLDKKVEISKKSASIHGSQVGYRKGEKVTLRELLYGLMLRSGNDAAIAIAEGVSGSVDEFLVIMNQYAAEIGLRDSHFESPHGLDSDNHYTTAYDLALLTSIAKENKSFNQIVGSKSIDAAQYGFTRSYNNINKILYQLPNANGVKTGYTGNAGKCLVSSVNYDGHDIVIVTLNCYERWNETKRIYNYVKENYIFKKLVSKDDVLDEIEVENSNDNIKVVCSEDVIIPLKKDLKYSYKYVKPTYEINAPIEKGTNIGYLNIIKIDKEEEVIMKINTTSKEAVNVKNELFYRIKKKLFNK